MTSPSRILIFTPLFIAGSALLFHLFSFYYSPSSNDKWSKFFSHSSYATSLANSSNSKDFSGTFSSGGSSELSGANKIALGQKIDINHATVEDLTALPVIGPKLAEKIVADRNQNGSFKTIESLMRVKGIKEKKFEKIRPYIALKP